MKLSALDPRVKLALLLIISTAALTTQRPVLLGAWLGLTALLLMLGGVSAAQLLQKTRTALKLILSIFVLQCLFDRSGDSWLSLGEATLVTAGGLHAGVYVGLRLLIIVLAALILLTGTRQDYLLALTQLGLPYEIAFMVLVGLRFLPFLREAAQDVLWAVQMRGGRLHGVGLLPRLRLYLSLVLPVVVLALRRSENLAIAMEARAFRCKPTRTFRRRLIMRREDWLYLAGFCAVFTALTAVILLLG